MLPFECIIKGTPVSQQARRRERLRAWQQDVRSQVKAKWPNDEAPSVKKVKVTLAYYYENVTMDTDNILKPVLDALKGLVLEDDGLVTDHQVVKRSLDGSFRVKGMSSVLAEGFCYGSDFLHLKIEEAPDQEEMV